MTDLPAASARLLVVDDEIPVTRLLRTYLTAHGHQVEEATGFPQVQAAFSQGTYDLVLLDVMLPQVDGLAVLAWLKTHHPDTGVVMATAVDQLDVVLAAMRGGAIGYMLKPFNLDLVGEEVTRALEQVRLIAANRAYQQRLETLVADRTRALSAAQAFLQRQVRELEARDRVVRLQLAPPANETEAHREIAAAAGQLAGASAAWLLRLPAGTTRLLPLAAWAGMHPDLDTLDAGDDHGDAAAPPEAVASLAIAALKDRGRPAAGEAGTVAVPVVYRQQALGVLAVTGASPAETPWISQALWRLAREAALVLRLVQVTQDLEAEQTGMDSILAVPPGREASPGEDPWPAS